MHYIEINAIKKFYKAALEFISDVDIEDLNCKIKFKNHIIVDKLAIILQELVEEIQKICESVQFINIVELRIFFSI
jgi:hypothetical protein